MLLIQLFVSHTLGKVQAAVLMASAFVVSLQKHGLGVAALGRCLGKERGHIYQLHLYVGSFISGSTSHLSSLVPQLGRQEAVIEKQQEQEGDPRD